MNRFGFTLIELLASMLIMSLILVITIPNIVEPSNKTKNVITNSKIETIKANVLKDAKKEINNKSVCTGTITPSKSECIYDAKTYLQKIDSKDTNIKGNIYICYDNSKLDITAYYSTDSNYKC